MSDPDLILVFHNPATGETFGQLPMTTPEDVQQALGEMRAAQPTWEQKPVKERVRILRRFQQLLIEKADDISAVINMDTGKSRQDALIEVFMTVNMLDAYLHRAAHWLRRYQVPNGLFIFKRCYVEPRPYGVVAVIAPWNYPFALAMPPVLAALLSGNTVILKPSEVTGATGQIMEQLLRTIPDLAPYVRVVHGDGRVGAALVQGAPDYIFLTGSTATGRKVMQTAAENLVPVACELGGKDAMIVLKDADLAAAAHWGVWGAYFNAGQTCMSVERVYVVEEVYDEFLRLVLEESETVRRLTGFSTGTNSPYYIGPISDPRQVKIIQHHLEDAQAKGARVILGGEIHGMFVEPTVLVNVNHSMLVMREETFGPLMPIMRVRDEAEAIRLANDCNYGLGASVWSRDVEYAWKIARQVEASSIIINDTIAQFAAAMLPFGGIKQSGYGRVHGKEGLMQFTRPFAYMVGNPPPAWDVATIMRSPGNYELGKVIMSFFFATGLRQRLAPATEYLAKQGTPLLETAMESAQDQLMQVGKKKALAVLGLGAIASAGLVLAMKRGRQQHGKGR